jgi:phytoene desaturase
MNLNRGASEQLEKYLAEAAYKYETGINNLVHKPGISFTEFIDHDILKGVFRTGCFYFN